MGIPIVNVHNILILHSLNFNKFTDAGRSQLGQAAGKRNNDQANYVHLSLGVVHM